jgi:hypothetical protein
MHIRSLRTALLASSALLFAVSGSALAQEQGCTQRLDQIEQQLAKARMDQQRQDDIQEVIRGARTLADTGDQEGCMQVVAELEDLTELLNEQSAADQQGQKQQAQQEQQQAQQEQQQLQQGGQAAGAEIRVQQPQPQITVSQPQPEVTVRVPPPQVTIRMPQPEVVVRMPQPEVVVRMPQPQVDIQMAEPEVQVRTPQPEVQVSMPEPDVQIQPAQPQVQVQEGEPKVLLQESQQQAKIQVQMAEPEVRFEQAEEQAKVTVEQQEPQVNVQRAQGGEQGQQQRQQLAAGGQQQAEQAEQKRVTDAEGQSAPDEEVAATEQPPATGESPLAAMPASDVIGTEVQNAEGETVAEIVDLVKEQGAEDLYAVLSVGGFLGIGDKKVVVPLEELDVDQQGEIIMANVTEDQLRDMPEYNEEGYESTAGLGEQPAEQQQ